MTLRHLKIFVIVCKENSITAASKKLFISQPAVSTAIKELEAYYNLPLFDRIAKKIYLTEAGKVVYHYALHIISLFEELEDTLKTTGSGSKLKIGSSITIGTTLIPGLIKSFSEHNPEAETYVTIDSSDIIENMILKNELDIALIEGIIHSDQIISKDFINDKLVVICDINHPFLQQDCIHINDLNNQKFLMREKNSGTRELAESILALNHITINPIWESTSTEAIIQGVSKGIGISILPLRLVHGYIKTKKIAVVEIDNLKFNRQYHIIYHKNKHLSTIAMEFMKLCSL